MKKTWMGFFVLCGLLFFTGCSGTGDSVTISDVQSQQEEQTTSAALIGPVDADKNEEPAPSGPIKPRAVGTASKGEILIVPITKEQAEPLGSPSCLGKETDVSFHGDYDVVYKDDQGQSTVIAKLEDLSIIAENHNPIQLGMLSIEGMDTFYFMPEPNGCSLVQMYVFSVDSNGNAFSWVFENTDVNGEMPSQSVLILPEMLPQVVDNQLVVPSVINKSLEGQDLMEYKITFAPDAASGLMKYKKKEPIPRND